MIQFEFNMFGGVTSTGTLPGFMLMLRLLGKEISIMIHQVVDDLANIQSHVGLTDKRLKLEVYRRLLRLFCWLVLLTSRNVAVHDQVLKDRLLKIGRRRIVVIPHGSGEYKAMCEYAEARQQLGFGPGEFVMLCFGFLAHYKGSDWIANEVVAHANELPATPLRLVLAGGESPNHKGTAHYTAFFADLLATAALCPGHIQVTGYVPDDRVPIYFTAADLVVFPYRNHIAASGPLAIALSFGCALLVSNTLRGVLTSEDFQCALWENGLTTEDIMFDLRPGELASKAMALSRDLCRLKKMRRTALAVAAARNWSTVARDYVKLIDE
jgi:glycosyltransferase involved in cell wall biosynthesis